MYLSLPRSPVVIMENYTIIIFILACMRGIVSLAIAIGLPATLSDSSDFPQRNTIIFISVVVVLFTFIGQGLAAVDR